MSAVLHTLHDVQTHLLELMGGSTDERARNVARRAIQEAYRWLPQERNWTYFYRPYRIITEAAYSTGTVVYDYTGGTYELELTLTGGTWPTNAAFGRVEISGVVYEVDERKSSTVLTLKAPYAPTADIASTSYQWHRELYPLPDDFHACDQMADLDKNCWPEFVVPGGWLLDGVRINNPSRPDYFTITGDPKANGGLAVRFSPPPDRLYNMDFVYQRRPRPLRVSDYSTGTVTVSSGSASVTGSSTAWTQAMVGAVIRFGTTAAVPDTFGSANQYVFEAVVKSVTSATALTLDRNADATYTAVKHRVSDWIDLEEGAMYNAFLRLTEAQFAAGFPRDDAGMRFNLANAAIRKAKENDSRFFSSPFSQPRWVGIKDMASGSDVG